MNIKKRMACGFFLIAICATSSLGAMHNNNYEPLNAFPFSLKQLIEEVSNIEDTFAFKLIFFNCSKLCCFCGLRNLLFNNKRITIQVSKTIVSDRQKQINNIAPKLQQEIKSLCKSNYLINSGTSDLKTMLSVFKKIEEEYCLLNYSFANKFLFEFSNLNDKNKLFPLDQKTINLFKTNINDILHKRLEKTKNYAAFEN